MKSPRWSAVLALLVLVLAGCERGRGEESVSAAAPAATPAVAADPGEVLVTTEGRFPTAAADTATGVTYVAWAVPAAAGGGTGTDIFVARVEGSETSTPVRVNAEAGKGGAHDQAPPSVAVGPDGAVYVAYIVNTPIEGRRFPASDVFLVRSTDGARTFEAPVRVNEDVGYPTGHHFHALAVGPEGTLYVSWLDARESDRASATPRDEPADAGYGAHGAHGAASPEATQAAKPQAMPHAGDAGVQVRVARSTDGGRSFAPSVLVARNTCECCRTALATGPDGTVYVGWRHLYQDESGGAIRDVAVARSTDGGRSFSTPGLVHADGWRLDGCPHAGPALAADEAGRLHAAWFTGAEGRMGAYYAVAEDGLLFGEPRPLVADPAGHGAGYRAGSHVALTALGDGEIEAAWEEATEQRVLIARVAADHSSDHAGGDDGAPLSPDVVLAGGYPVAARSGTAGHIAFSRGDSLLVWAPPAGGTSPWTRPPVRP